MEETSKTSSDTESVGQIKIEDELKLETVMMEAPKNRVSAGAKRWAYFISVSAPPFGLLFALYYYLSGKEDGKRTAYTCTLLTAVVLVVFWLIAQSILSQSGATLEQIRQINPEEIQELYQ